MESLRPEGLSNPDLDPDITHPVSPVLLNDLVPGTETWEVKWMADPKYGTSGGHDYKLVTVTVGWTQAGIADQVAIHSVFLAP